MPNLAGAGKLGGLLMMSYGIDYMLGNKSPKLDAKKAPSTTKLASDGQNGRKQEELDSHALLCPTFDQRR